MYAASSKQGFNIVQRQSGAALVIGLILLMVLTLLGVSGMSMSRLELLMADNNKQQTNAFQAADTVLINQIIGGSAIVYGDALARDAVVRDWEPMEIMADLDGDATPDSVATVNVQTTFQQLADPFGYNVGLVDAVHFKVEAQAESAQRGGRSVHHGGFFIKAPRSGN